MSIWKKWFSVKTEPKVSKLTSIVNRYKAIQPEAYSNAFSSDNSILTVDVFVGTIEDYTEYLTRMTILLSSNRQLTTAHINKQVTTVYLRDFFIGKNGVYLDPVESIRKFVSSVESFLNTYELKELNETEDFVVSRNLYLLSTVVGNLCVLIEEI